MDPWTLEKELEQRVILSSAGLGRLLGSGELSLERWKEGEQVWKIS